MTRSGGAHGARPPSLDALAAAECLLLAASVPVGRIAFFDDDADLGPVVVPVNHRIDGRDVLFRTRNGAVLHAVGRGPMSFQTDLVDPSHQSGWSVLVRGHARQVGSREVDDHDLVTWMGDAAVHAVRLVPITITGRRLRPTEPEHDEPRHL